MDKKASISELQIAFIVCMGRSGSTLLQHLFDAHSAVVSPIESKFVLHLRTKYRNVQNWNEKTIDGFIQDLYTDRKFRLFWKVDPVELRALFDRYEVTCFADACKVVYLAHPSLHTADAVRLIVDKNPAHSLYVGYLQEIFPDATFIHLVRDPRPVMRSQMRALHKKSVYLLSHQYNLMNRKAMEGTGLNRIVVRYEDLVTDPEAALKTLLDRLNVPFEAAMLHRQDKIKDRVEDQKSFLSLEHHRNIGNPVNTDSLEKWRTELTPHEIHVIEAICRPMASNFGYVLPSVELTGFQKIRSVIGRLRMQRRKGISRLVFRSPFWLRKMLFNTISFFFDRRFK